MTPAQTIAIGAALLAGGLWLQLPRGATRGRWWGMVLAAVGIGILASLLLTIQRAHPVAETVFFAVAVTTVVSAVGAVTMRSPVYCALWFALTLVGTAALLLFQGAQFLGMATMVVYAGAILVTFLFVLMLAQPEGHTYYDRVSWEPVLAACTGAVLIGLLTASIFLPTEGVRQSGWKFDAVTAVTTDARQQEILDPDHMAHLGGQLFSRYLVAVEVAGTLLLVALVGAVAIVMHGEQKRGGRAPSSGAVAGGGGRVLPEVGHG
ncbi:MAG TPA: NADH-quinone oxidoreductase subunit J [Pirellulales bacterium]|nr:NADH-quinone oxidoreductase subunit J [Pirellulales bacterium]